MRYTGTYVVEFGVGIGKGGESRGRIEGKKGVQDVVVSEAMAFEK